MRIRIKEITGQLYFSRKQQTSFEVLRSRASVAIVVMMIEYDMGNLRISDPSGWSRAVTKKAGLRRTRYDAIEYSTGVAGRRGVHIGCSREIIL